MNSASLLVRVNQRPNSDVASLAQLVRASGCGSEGRGFDPHSSPHKHKFIDLLVLWVYSLLNNLRISNA
jgi:hypothetical protein